MGKDTKITVEDQDIATGEVENIDTTSDRLEKKLDTRHLVMISIGNSIGQGLWLGTGPALVEAGPASLFIGFFISTTLTFTVAQAVGELSVMYPLPAPFAQWCLKFLDRSSAISVGFSYWLSCSISYANQIQAINTILQYWTSAVPAAAWITIFNVFFVCFGFLGVKYFGEIEVFFTTIKVLWIFVVIVASSVVSARQDIGFHYWRTDPCINGFKGFLTTLSTAIFAMAGTEMMGVSSPECKNPKKAFPKAVKTIWVRMGLFYVCGSLMAGIVVSPFNSELSSATLNSPFSIGFKNGGLPGLAQAMNAIILVSVISSAISDPFAASRQLHGLADLGIFPRIFNKVDKRGVPWVGVLSSIILGGGLSYLNVSESGTSVFSWFSNLVSLTYIYVWGIIFVCHIRMRYAWKKAGRANSEMPWRTSITPYSSYYGLTLCILILIVEFYLSVWPLKETSSAENFFANFISIVLIVFVYAGSKLWYREPFYVKSQDVDLDSGLRIYPEEKPENRSAISKLVHSII